MAGGGQRTTGPWLGFVDDELESWWGRCSPEDSAGLNQGQLVARVRGMVSWALKEGGILEVTGLRGIHVTIELCRLRYLLVDGISWGGVRVDACTW